MIRYIFLPTSSAFSTTRLSAALFGIMLFYAYFTTTLGFGMFPANEHLLLHVNVLGNWTFSVTECSLALNVLLVNVLCSWTFYRNETLSGIPLNIPGIERSVPLNVLCHCTFSTMEPYHYLSSWPCIMGMGTEAALSSGRGGGFPSNAARLGRGMNFHFPSTTAG